MTDNKYDEFFEGLTKQIQSEFNKIDKITDKKELRTFKRDLLKFLTTKIAIEIYCSENEDKTLQFIDHSIQALLEEIHSGFEFKEPQ